MSDEEEDEFSEKGGSMEPEDSTPDDGDRDGDDVNLAEETLEETNNPTISCSRSTAQCTKRPLPKKVVRSPPAYEVKKTKTSSLFLYAH